MTKEFFIPYDGIRLHAKLDVPEPYSVGSVSGTARKHPLAIVIHGFTGHMEERHILAVTETFCQMGIAVLRAEMYGHGQSDGKFRDHTLYKWVTGALAVVEYAKKMDFVSDLYLCGHSQGGLLTMMIAGMLPDVFRAVVPLSPAWMIPEEARSGNMLGVSFDPEHIPEELDFGEGKILGGNYVRTAQTIHPEDEIARYKGPVLIVQGGGDETVLVEYAYKAASMYKNCRLVIVPGDTHCYDLHLELVMEAVRDFMAGLTDGPAGR